MTDPTQLSVDVTEPTDDGAADHLTGRAVPSLVLTATGGKQVDLSTLEGRTIVYVYPMTGKPGTDQPEGWDAIPGARGCTAEACSWRDHHLDLQLAGVRAVYGLSSQATDYQTEAAGRLRLPFGLLSDAKFALAKALSLPTFKVGNSKFYSRLTLIVNSGVIEHVFYPVFPPGEHADQVLDWVRSER